jgi:hypothetical protein
VERGVADPAEIQQLAEQDQSAAALNPTMVIAIVGSGDVPYGLARMWEALRGGAVRDSRLPPSGGGRGLARREGRNGAALRTRRVSGSTTSRRSISSEAAMADSSPATCCLSRVYVTG